MTNGTYQQYPPTYQQYPPQPTYPPYPPQQSEQEKKEKRERNLGILLGLVSLSLGIKKYIINKPSTTPTPTVECTSDWQCELPLNGYEHDLNNCDSNPENNRRAKSSCIPIPTPNLYVSSTSGNDSNPGTQTSPVKTISRAIAIATSGNTIYVKNGTYQEKVVVNKPISLYGENNDGTIIDGSPFPISMCGYPPVWCRDFRSGLVSLSSDNITFKNFKVQNSKAAGIVSLHASNITIENNHTYKTWGSGIQCHHGDNIKVRYNEIERADSPDINRGVAQEQISFSGGATDEPTYLLTNFDISYNHVHNGSVADNGSMAGSGAIYMKTGCQHGSCHHNYVTTNSYQNSGIYSDSWNRNDIGYANKDISIYNNLVEQCGVGISVNTEVSSIPPNPPTITQDINVTNNIITGNGVGFVTPNNSNTGIINNLSVKNNTIYKNGSCPTYGRGLWLGRFEFANIPTYSNMIIQDNIICNNCSDPQIRIDSHIPSSQYTLTNNHITLDYISLSDFTTLYNNLRTTILNNIT